MLVVYVCVTPSLCKAAVCVCSTPNLGVPGIRACDNLGVPQQQQVEVRPGCNWTGRCDLCSQALQFLGLVECFLTGTWGDTAAFSGVSLDTHINCNCVGLGGCGCTLPS